MSIEFPVLGAAGGLAYHRVFGADVTFGAPRNSLSFESAILDRPVQFADPALAEYLHARAAAMLDQLPAAGAVRQRVRQAISNRLCDASEIKQVARRLGTSARSLQRALMDEGTSFQEIRDEVRRSVALDLLEQRSLSIGEIAALVGYAQSSAFRAALHRWTGSSAREMRRGDGLPTGRTRSPRR